MSLRDDIFAVNDRKIEPVQVPEWGKTLYVRSLSGAERDTMETALLNANRAGTLKGLGRAIVAVAYGCDETGASIWTQEDAPALADKNANALERIRKAGDVLNKLDTSAEETLEKN